LRYEVEVDGLTRRVAVNRVGGRFAVAVDGHTWYVDAARIDDYTLSLIVGTVPPNGDTGGSSYAVTMVPETAGQLGVIVGATSCTVTVNGGGRRRKDDGSRAGDGPDRIKAPMSGNVVRILVEAGDAVRARQPLVVIEAMKKENELRAGRDGTVAEIFVKEGASVDAGAPLFEIR
jgi:biotin carboxyl carrier protein